MPGAMVPDAEHGSMAEVTPSHPKTIAQTPPSLPDPEATKEKATRRKFFLTPRAALSKAPNSRFSLCPKLATGTHRHAQNHEHLIASSVIIVCVPVASVAGNNSSAMPLALQ